MSGNQHKQSGYAILLLTATLAIVAFGFVLGYSTFLAKKEAGALLTEQSAYLQTARSSLEAVYQSNLAQVDSDAEQQQYRDADVWLEQAGVSRRWNLQAAVSNRLTASGVAYTVVALWIPDSHTASNPSSFDPVTGNFTVCTNSGAVCPPRAYVLVSGLQMQLTAQKLAEAQLNDISSKMGSYFDAKYLRDPDHNQNTNSFRAPSGNCDNADEMPCVDTYTTLSDTRIPGLLGIASSQLIHPWGIPVQVSNLQDARTNSSPYSVSFQSATPWGTNYQIQALQKL